MIAKKVARVTASVVFFAAFAADGFVHASVPLDDVKGAKTASVSTAIPVNERVLVLADECDHFVGQPLLDVAGLAQAAGSICG